MQTVKVREASVVSIRQTLKVRMLDWSDAQENGGRRLARQFFDPLSARVRLWNRLKFLYRRGNGRA
jgi:hypothetical protein